FIIFRTDEKSERVPLTVADYDRENGTITIIFQTIGGSTKRLALLNEGDFILDFVGPLGTASHFDNVKKAAVIGGGVGCAIAYPQAKMLHEMNCDVDIIAGFRNKDIVILEQEMKNVSTKLTITTDDGSYGEQGFVTNKLQKELDDGVRYDVVVAIGPVPMMKAICEVTKPYGIKTIVSLNPIMIDGTGMCGGCRVTVGGAIKFACVDGPDFDGHEVDFDELMRRNKFYKDEEERAVAKPRCGSCNLLGGENHG
ncbi:MAG: sulfide/dihydroorotate dehydrogenase-like FAD/NAD-binding protein, partial [Niameybacter sp.]